VLHNPALRKTDKDPYANEYDSYDDGKLISFLSCLSCYHESRILITEEEPDDDKRDTIKEKLENAQEAKVRPHCASVTRTVLRSLVLGW
jgi:hypothetical protein